MIFSAFERLVAFRYLRARRQEGFISVIAWFSLLGIALGVATLIIVMAVMNGFRAELLGRILGLNGHITISAPGGQAIPDADKLVARLKAMDGVVFAAPMVEGQVMVSANGVAGGALVRGMTPEDLRARRLIADSVRQGSIEDMGDDGVLIGSRMAYRLGLKLGDGLTVLSPRGESTAFGSVPRIKTYRIAGIFEVGMYEYDNTYVYAPLSAAQIFFRLPQAVSGIEIMLTDPNKAAVMTYMLSGLVPPGVRAVDWQQANSSFFNAIQVERNVMFLILTLIILVAAFNIISSMIMMVKDKGRDIAVLRTMGATRGMILRIFLLSGASIGIIGTGAGLLIGVLFCENIESIRQFLQNLTGTQLFQAEIYFLSRLPAKMDVGEVLQVVTMAFSLSLLATIYPALRAARLNPVEALRYE
ncbi:lipoprotein-releasing ABC transporter permease subunit [Elstera sp.]|jgi:lipoprotein-releasing system permease protein|uniref:lipoprotein-releasing ABC transporter permease subunit n=1 Tax=Elstera sp. TaxID=1916664 RepID=UPI0037BFBAF7